MWCLPAQTILMTRAAVNTSIPLPGALIFLRTVVKNISGTCNMARQTRQWALLGRSSFQQCCELPGCGYVKGDTGKNLTGNIITRKEELLLIIQNHIKDSHPWMPSFFITRHPTDVSKSFWQYKYRGKVTSSREQWLLWPWWRNKNSFCPPKGCDLLPLIFSVTAWDLLMSIPRCLQVPVPSWAFDRARQDRLCKVITHIFNFVPLCCFSLP